MEHSNSKIWELFKNNPNNELKQALVVSYLRLVHYVIHSGPLNFENILDYEDYFQFGVEGLNEAIERFDPSKGVKFETYAYQRIRGKMLDGIRKTIKVHPLSVLSINKSDEDGDPIEIADNSFLPDEILEKNLLKSKLKEAIDLLDNDRDREMIKLYYYEELTFSEIAKVFGITSGRVSQVHTKIIEEIKLSFSVEIEEGIVV